jgi:type IV pilus assembly protein PilN
MDLSVNLASQPYVDSRLLVRALRIAICVVSMTAIVGGTAEYFVHQRAEIIRSQTRAIETHAETLRVEERAYRVLMHSSSVVDIANKADELNEILDAKAFSWTSVMKNLETVLPGDVRVTAIEPMRAKDGITTLHLRVVGPHDKSIDLLRNFESSSRFAHPMIMGESVDDGQETPKQNATVASSTTMNFDLLVQYKGDVRDEAPKIEAAHIELTDGQSSKPSPSGHQMPRTTRAMNIAHEGTEQ